MARSPRRPNRVQSEPASAGPLLVNRLSVTDARHLLRSEGGELTPGGLALRIVGIAAVQIPVAWAIATGGATLWHLLLPMFGQYFGALVAMPLAYAWWRPAGLKKDAFGSVRLLVIFALAAAVTTYVRSQRADLGWQAQAELDARAAVDWVVGYKMHWPMLAAFVSSAIDMRSRVLQLAKHGPPFVGASLGCAMRFIVVLLGVFLLPVVAANWDKAPWFVWGVVLLGESLALWMHWDLQARLRKIDGGLDHNRSETQESTPTPHPLEL